MDTFLRMVAQREENKEVELTGGGGNAGRRRGGARQGGSSVQCRRPRNPNRKLGGQSERNDCDDGSDCKGPDTARPCWHVSIVERRLHSRADFLPRAARRARSCPTRP